MSCNKVQPKLSAYLDGEMSGVEMQQFRRHLNDCGSCQKEYEGLRAVQLMLRDLPAGPEPSEMLVSNIQKSVAATRTNYLRLALVVAVPALCWAIFAFSRPQHDKAHDRDIAMSKQLANEQMFDSGSDPMSGAASGHYATFDAR